MFSKPIIGIIILVIILISVLTLIGLTIGGVIQYPFSKKCPPVVKCPGTECNIQKNVAGDLIQCPPDYNTNYLTGVSVAADCDLASGRCNRCIGWSLPDVIPGYVKWPNSKVDSNFPPHAVPTTSGKIAKYQGGVFVTDSAPISSKCGI